MPVAYRETRPKRASLYETDYRRWAQEQSCALREGRSSDIDWENVAEEIELLGRTDKRAIENHLEVLLAHLLKCVIQPDRHTRSWDLTIQEQRRSIARLIERNPSLRGLPEERFASAYRDAVWRAYRDTGIAKDAFPETSPFTLDQVLDAAFMPGPAKP